MKSDLDRETLSIACPACGKKTVQTIGKLKTSPKLTCADCGATIDVDAKDLAAGLDKAQKALADLKRRLGKLGK